MQQRLQRERGALVTRHYAGSNPDPASASRSAALSQQQLLLLAHSRQRPKQTFGPLPTQMYRNLGIVIGASLRFWVLLPLGLSAKAVAATS
jgi:hypothetical protein